MAAKIVRQPDKIALLGSPTSAAALAAGHEASPAAFRAAGLVDRLQSIGYQVADLGDDPVQIYQPDEESPRARNIPAVLFAIEALKPRVEQAVKSLALPLILGGDSSVTLGTIAGVRRYFRNVGMIYMNSTADMLIPATTSNGSVDRMVVSHITGRGAAELVRFWGEPPLVRDPDLAIFGASRVESAEEDVLRQSPVRRYLAPDVRRMGPVVAAQAAVEHVRGSGYQFILHFNVSVIRDFLATDEPSTDGLGLEEVRAALEVFLTQKHLAAVVVTGYTPAKDADGSGLKSIIDLLADLLAKRLDVLREGAPAAAKAGNSVSQQAEPSKEDGAPPSAPAVVAGEAWSSDSLDAGESSAENPSDESHS